MGTRRKTSARIERGIRYGVPHNRSQRHSFSALCYKHRHRKKRREDKKLFSLLHAAPPLFLDLPQAYSPPSGGTIGFLNS